MRWEGRVEALSYESEPLRHKTRAKALNYVAEPLKDLDRALVVVA